MNGFEISISRVANTLVSQSSLFNCSLEEAWRNYMHPFITDQVTFGEVMEYIQDKVKLSEEGRKNG